MLPVCLGPLRYATSFILVGDHNQLPPLIRSSAARRGGLDFSLFRRLCESHPAAVVSLSEQYRMNDDIMAVANRLVYDGQLRCGDNATATRRLSVPHLHELSTGTCSCPMASCWLIQCALPE
jgi:DNA replication ATP-dependent helicase Dna2